MLAKLENETLKVAPRKIVVDGKTTFNPDTDTLKSAGYKEVHTSDAPETISKTVQYVQKWTDNGNYILQTWELVPNKPDAIETLLKIQAQEVIERIKQEDDKTLGIQCMALFEPWKRGIYSVGDVRTDPKTGYPYECITAHDSASNPDWTIENRTLWKPWHSRLEDYALPWVQPTGAHDMYKDGEYMIWTDKKVYKCILDTNFSPTEYSQAWEAAA